MPKKCNSCHETKKAVSFSSFRKDGVKNRVRSDTCWECCRAMLRKFDWYIKDYEDVSFQKRILYTDEIKKCDGAKLLDYYLMELGLANVVEYPLLKLILDFTEGTDCKHFDGEVLAVLESYLGRDDRYPYIDSEWVIFN